MKKKIYELLRKYVAKRATHNLGKVEITDDEVICYVDGKKLKKQMKEKYLTPSAETVLFDINNVAIATITAVESPYSDFLKGSR